MKLMKSLSRLKSQLMILTVSVLSLSYLSGCRNKIDVGELCVTLEEPSFWCANQKIPNQREGFLKPYKPNMICQEADQYNKLIDQLTQYQTEIARYKYK